MKHSSVGTVIAIRLPQRSCLRPAAATREVRAPAGRVRRHLLGREVRDRIVLELAPDLHECDPLLAERPGELLLPRRPVAESRLRPGGDPGGVNTAVLVPDVDR